MKEPIKKDKDESVFDRNEINDKPITEQAEEILQALKNPKVKSIII